MCLVAVGGGGRVRQAQLLLAGRGRGGQAAGGRRRVGPGSHRGGEGGPPGRRRSLSRFLLCFCVFLGACAADAVMKRVVEQAALFGLHLGGALNALKFQCAQRDSLSELSL